MHTCVSDWRSLLFGLSFPENLENPLFFSDGSPEVQPLLRSRPEFCEIESVPHLRNIGAFMIRIGFCGILYYNFWNTNYTI